jgi:hypothetical protein
MDIWDLVGDCWNLYELGPITNCKIPNKSQRPIHVSKEDVETLQYHLACKVEVVILKYRSPLYFLKSSMRRRKRSPHARARLASPRLAWWGEGRGRAAPAWMVRRNPAPRLAGARSPFTVLVFGFLAFKLQSLNGYKLRVLKRLRSWSWHEVGWKGLYKQPTDHAKTCLIELEFLPILAVAPPS